MKKRNIIVLGIIAVVIIRFAININSSLPKSSESPDTLVNYLIPLQTTKPENGFKDLEALKEVLQNKKIIAMGEATHGTKEFFEMKHRMFEFLVEELGYRIFAIEADFARAQIVNDYILYGKGSLSDSLKALKSWIWQTEEVANLIEWMRNYNQNPNNSSKIKFYGFDISGDPSISKTRIMEYLKEVDAGTFGDASSNFNSLTIEELELLLDENKQSYINQTSESEYNMIYQHLNIIKQNAVFLDTPRGMDSFNLRDYYMAENVQWIVDYEKQFGNVKIMLWAHNGHAAKEFLTSVPLGKHLYEIYSDELYTIGFDFYKGSLRAYPGTIFGTVISNIVEFNVRLNEGYFASSFHKTGIPIGFIDFKSSSKDEALNNWLSETHYIRHIGAVYSPYIHQTMPSVPINAFDAIIFVDETSAAIGTEGAESSTQSSFMILTKYYLARLAVVIFLFLFWLWLTGKLLSTFKRGLKFFNIFKG